MRERVRTPPKLPYREVAYAISKARTSAGVTQVELAKRMGTTQTAIARLESGRVAPKTSTLQRFADAIEWRLVIDFQKNDHKLAKRKETQDDRR
jgi:predicted transcriptional regulator